MSIRAATEAGAAGGRRIALRDGGLRFWPDLFLPGETELLSRLRAEVHWRQHRVRLFGREHDAPRLSAWHGDAGCRYRYSGQQLEPQPWTPTLQKLRNDVSRLCNCEFNSVLLNRYRDGNDAMGWHSDDEAELDGSAAIAALSLGAPRRFLLRHRDELERRVELELGQGSLLLMEPPLQRFWKHSLPRTRRTVGERISLTFRRVILA